MGAFGLTTHISSNNFRSILLMAGFPVLLLLVMYAFFLLYAGLAGEAAAGAPEFAQPFVWAADAMGRSWPFALVGAAVWFGIAYLSHQALIDLSTGAHEVHRLDEPRPYTLLENLCISRGMAPPTLRIIETPALNAFASGLHEGQFTITLTRGLLETLDDGELETVIAHELTHIRNRDVRLLVISVIFVGIFSFVGELMFRGLTNMRLGGGRDSSDNRSSGGAAILAVLAALVIIAVAYALAVVIRFALSRRREYLADAGAVELTKNPDGLISALRKISTNHTVPRAPAEVREMFIENSHAGIGEIFATHPPIEKRIAALIKFAGGQDTGAGEAHVDMPAPAPNWRKGPWG